MKLIKIWGDESIQAMLESCMRNRDVFTKIMCEMEPAGYHKTSEQCNSKIRKLKLEYRKIKDDSNKTGRGSKTWTFFEAMDSVLGHKPATQLSVLIESGEVVEATNEPAKSDEDDVDGEGKVGNSESGQSSLDGNEGSVTTSRPETQVVEENKAAWGSKKRRSNEKVNKMKYLIEKVIKMQKESNEPFLRFEGKMLEVEER